MFARIAAAFRSRDKARCLQAARDLHDVAETPLTLHLSCSRERHFAAIRQTLYANNSAAGLSHASYTMHESDSTELQHVCRIFILVGQTTEAYKRTSSAPSSRFAKSPISCSSIAFHFFILLDSRRLYRPQEPPVKYDGPSPSTFHHARGRLLCATHPSGRAPT